ncbi:MAG: polymer-forming cytoskeletal protein [Bacteroides sp.]|nr:polymer-forming cytoskeletal protein [Bacteroides sp.]MCM1530771.1 polymer-forming cytoskeletal protein [Ruminococcus flavefaciens]MCM1554155.1 polymer-forming cytoskeletal protein [Bacteroides sp.]
MTRQAENEALQSYNVLGAGTSVKGALSSNGNLRIDGSFEGTLAIEGKLVVGSTGSLIGSVRCASAEIEGNVKTDKMEVSGLLSLKSTSMVEGEITIQKLFIEQGAVFNGQCNMPQERA